jgi:hypothetical protein
VLERRANHRSADVKHPVQSILHQASNARLLMKGSYEKLLIKSFLQQKLLIQSLLQQLIQSFLQQKLVATIAPAKSLLSNPLH